MPSLLFHLLLALAFAAAVIASQHNSLRVHHRLYHPIAPHLPFAQRGSVDWHASPHPAFQFQPVQSISEYLKQAADLIQPGDIQLDEIQYQLALERAEDSAEAQWDVSSVKLCHLEHSKFEQLILHATDGPDPTPFAMDYFVAPIPQDGSCPQTSAKSRRIKEALSTRLQSISAKVQPLNTTVSIRRSGSPPLPELRTPPPLTEAGEPVTPVAEKSFLQKYWLYIVAVLIALLVSGGPPEEEGKK